MSSVCVAGPEAVNWSAALQQRVRSAEHKLTICSIQSVNNGYSLTREMSGKPLNKQKTDWCKALIVTVCYNKEVIYQLLSAAHSWTVNEELFETLDRAREHKNPTLTHCSKLVPLKLVLFLSSRQDGTLCFMFPSLPSLVSSALFCRSPSVLSARPPALSIARLHTLFHHLNCTSPLKDWPHTKLLFKGKKYTRRGVERGVAGRVRVHAPGSPYEHSNTGNDPPHPRAAR